MWSTPRRGGAIKKASAWRGIGAKKVATGVRGGGRAPRTSSCQELQAIWSSARSVPMPIGLIRRTDIAAYGVGGLQEAAPETFRFALQWP
jgi:hypothetical protein